MLGIDSSDLYFSHKTKLALNHAFQLSKILIGFLDFGFLS